MPCSAVTLSLATITGIIATALLSIAFSTDNWLYTEVKRDPIISYEKATTPNVSAEDRDSTKLYYYYTRTQGLFRICFPGERPANAEIYLSPVETHCMNVDYFLRDDKKTASFTEEAMARLHMGRSVIALFMVAFLAIFTAFWTGVVGCWKRSSGNITATAILMLLACLLSAGAMGLWHGVEHYEKDKEVGVEFYHQWIPVLKANSVQWYDWSFYLAWLGVATCLGSMTLFLIAASCLRKERAREQAQSVQYIMPVYPQKQQYAYAGYPAPAAYPGPYYHGSQGYGPYNY